MFIAWIEGRRVRRNYGREPALHESLTYGSTVLFVMLDGAFNSSYHHSADIHEKLLRHGDVLEVEWSRERYDEDVAFATAKERLLSYERNQYQHIVIHCGSMGALVSLRLLACLRAYFGLGVKVSLIANDPVLNSRCLPSVLSKLRLPLSWVHPGPVFNWLARPILKRVFTGIPKDNWEESANPLAIRRHFDAMHSFELSAVVDMLASMAAKCREFSPLNFTYVHAVRLRSSKDGVLDVKGADEQWNHFFPSSPTIPIEGGEHLTYLEHPQAWSHGLDEALSEIGIPSIPLKYYE